MAFYSTNHANCQFSNSQFVGNTATVGGGGAINSSGYGPSITGSDCLFRENSSVDGGGAVFIDWPQAVSLRNSRFENNVTAHCGGALSAGHAPDLSVEGCTFIQNTAGDHGGGANVGALTGGAGLVNCTFWSNVASNDNPGITADATVSISNSVLWGDHFPNGVPKETGGGGSPMIVFSDVQGGWTGQGNIDADPLFFDPENGDYRLGAGSACIDAGDNASVPPELTTDIDGNPRITDGNNDALATVDMGAYETVDCNSNAVPDWSDIALGTSQDCNANDIPDECDIASGVSEDCNANGVPDECEVPPIGPPENDLNNNGIPDDCEDQTCTNLTTGVVYPTIAAAIAAAQDGHELLATELAFMHTADIDFIGKQVLLMSTAAIMQPGAGLINITNNADLATAAGGMLTVRGTLRSASAAVADVTAGSFVLESNATLRARLGSTLSVDTMDGSTLDGLTYVEANATLNFSGPVTNIETVTVVAGGTFSASDLFTNGATFGTLNSNVILAAGINEGDMNLPNVSLLADLLTNTLTGQLTGYGQFYTNLTNNGDVIFTGNTTLVGDVLNNATGRIYLQIGTTTLIGNLTNNGAIIGTFATDKTAGRLDLLGSFVADAGATLRLPQAGTVFSVTGNYDNAINDPARFDLRLATLQLRGALVPQILEVMSTDIGPVPAGLDPSQPGHCPVGTLHIGADAPAIVQLVDNRDNDGLGQSTPEAIYADTVHIDAGATLDNPAYKTYYNTLVNNGTVTHPENLVKIGTVERGDLNCDGTIGFGDINPFVLYLSNFAVWQSTYADCPPENGDINGDGSYPSFGDINPFVALLSGGE